MRKFLRGIVLLLVATIPLLAHELGAVQAEITFKKNGTFQADVQVDPEHLPLALNPFTGLPPVVPQAELVRRKEAFQQDFLEKLELRFDGVKAAFNAEALPSGTSADLSSAWRFGFRLTGAIPKNARAFTWSHPYKMGQYLLRQRFDGDLEPRKIGRAHV